MKRTWELILLAAATLVFVHVVGRQIGMNVDDDSGTLFLSQSSNWLHSGELIYGNWSPLYLLWFRLLAMVCPEPMRLYFFDWKVLAVLLALLPPLLRVRNAWLYTLAVLTLPVLMVGPYMAQFAAIFPLLALCYLLHREPSYSTALACGSAVCFVMEFVRPEYGYALYLCAVGTCVAALLEWRGSAQRRWLVGKVALVLLLSVAMHGIQANGVDHRSGQSLEQHFNLRAQEQGKLPAGESPWFSNYAQLQFGVDVTHHPPDSTANLGDFIRANPRLFVSHLLDNLRDGRTWAILLFFAVGTGWPWLLLRARELRPTAVMLALMCAAPTAGVVVVYPREHYPVAVTPALILLAVQSWGLYGPRRITWPVVSMLVSAMLCFMELSRVRLQSETFGAQRAIEASIRCAMQVDQTQPVEGTVPSRVYIGMPNVMGYLPHQHVGLEQWEDFSAWPDLQGWVKQKQPVLVELSNWKLGTMQVTPAEADQFMQTEMGYTRHSCSVDAGVEVYTKDIR